MGKSKKPKPWKTHRFHTVEVEIPEAQYQRYRVLDGGKSLLIDFRCIRTQPFKPVDYGARRKYKWRSPKQLQALVDEYFDSCYGPVRNPKTGGFYENEDGTLTIGQIKPFTISGLALYTHIETQTLREYKKETIDSLGWPTDTDYDGPQYSEIMLEAVKRVENYAEERLYDRDGFGGGRFVLNAAFKWTEKKEQAEIDNMKAQIKLKEKELKFRKKQAALGDDVDEPVTITIRRAGGTQDDSE